GRLVQERAVEGDVDGHRLVVVIRDDAGTTRVVAVGRVLRADRAVVPVTGADGGLAVHGGGEVAVQAAAVVRPVDAQRERLLVQRVDGEPVAPPASVAGAADRVLREDGVDTVESREGGVARRAQVEERGIGGEVDRERDRRHRESDGCADGAAPARAWIAEDVYGARGVRIALRLAVADLGVARPAGVPGAGGAGQPRRPAGRGVGREADGRAGARAIGRDEVRAARLGAAGGIEAVPEAVGVEVGARGVHGDRATVPLAHVAVEGGIALVRGHQAAGARRRRIAAGG